MNVLIPGPRAFQKAVDETGKEDLPLLATLDGLARQAMQNELLYAQYKDADAMTMRALAHGLLLGIAIGVEAQRPQPVEKPEI